MDQFEKRVETLLHDLADSEFPDPDTIDSGYPARDALSVGGSPIVLVAAKESPTTRWPARSAVAVVLLVIAALVGIAAFGNRSANVDTAGPASIVSPAGEGRTGTDPQPRSLAAGLADAKARWQQFGSENYLVTVDQRVGNLRGCQWVTEVHAADTSSRWSADFDADCGEWDVSIPGLYHWISDRMVEFGTGDGRLAVDWAANGVPTRLEIRWDSPDIEPRSFTIEFRDLSNETADSSIRVALAEAKARWAAAGIDRYTLVVAEEVNYWSKGCRWITEITAGVVTRTEVDSSSRSQNCVEAVITVESLHDRIAVFADTIEKYSDPGFGVHILKVSFNEFGVPETVVYDLANGADEETSLRVEFTPAAPQP